MGAVRRLGFSRERSVYAAGAAELIRRNLMNRRHFLQSATTVALAGGAQNRWTAQQARKMIGIQVGAVSFVDESVDKVLDEFVQDAAINTLFVATFTYGRGIAGRQVPGQPLPDHGKREYDTE